MYSPQSDKNTIDEDKAQLMTKQLLVELGLDIDSYSMSNRYVLKNILFRYFYTYLIFISKKLLYKLKTTQHYYICIQRNFILFGIHKL